MKKLPLQFLGFLAGAIAVLLMAVMPRTQAHSIEQVSAVRGKLRQRTVSLYRSMSYGLFCPGTI